MKKTYNYKFKIGDKVTILNPREFKTDNEDGIPSRLIRHGSWNPSPDENDAVIYATHKEFYVVSYTDESGKKVRLGFEEEDLELLNPQPAIDSSIDWEDVEEPEFDEKCTIHCKPADHVCGK